jgi:hypothetical protein
VGASGKNELKFLDHARDEISGGVEIQQYGDGREREHRRAR